MRISVDEQDSGYQAYIESGVYWNVYLDGVLQDKCITADEELGMIKRIVQPYQIIEINGEQEFVQEVVYGKVELKSKKENQ